MELIQLTVLSRNGRPTSGLFAFDINDISRVITTDGINTTVVITEQIGPVKNQNISADQTVYVVSESIAVIASLTERIVALNVVSVKGRIKAGSPLMGFVSSSVVGPVRSEGAGAKFFYQEDNDPSPVEYVVTQSVAAIVAMGISSSSLSNKLPARAATVANTSLTVAVATIDGVVLAPGDRVLVKAQTLGENNGIYIFNGVGVPLTRALDFNQSIEAEAGLTVVVTEGTVNADTMWELATNAPITLGVTVLTFIKISASFQASGTLNKYIKFTPDGVTGGDALLFDNAVSVGLGTATPSASSLFDVTSTSQGFLTPRMTTVERDAIAAPATGLLVYNLTTSLFNYWDGAVWTEVDSGTGDFSNGGNSFGAAATLGTNDAFDLQFETNGAVKMIIRTGGQISAGDSTYNNLFMGLTSGLLINGAGGGVDNTSYGVNSLAAITTGSDNDAFGFGALAMCTIGTFNSAYGFSSLTSCVDGDRNSAFGSKALQANLSNDNVAVGHAVLIVNTTGTQNTGMGSRTLFSNIVGIDNTGIGYNSLKSNTADSNTAVGSQSMLANTTGTGCTAVGFNSMIVSVDGNYNCSYGFYTMSSNTSGAGNSAFGKQSLNANTTGSQNSVLGMHALLNNVTGANNVAVGFEAGNNSVGSGNVFLGFNAGYSETGSNKLYISNTSTATPLIYGDFALHNLGINTNSFGATSDGILSMINAAGIPSANDVTDIFRMYSADYSGAGTATAIIRNEEGHLFTFRRSGTYTITNDSTDRTINAMTAGLGETKDILCTLIRDLALSGWTVVA